MAPFKPLPTCHPGVQDAPKSKIAIKEVYFAPSAQDAGDSRKLDNCMTLFKSLNQHIQMVSKSKSGVSKLHVKLCMNGDTNMLHMIPVSKYVCSLTIFTLGRDVRFGRAGESGFYIDQQLYSASTHIEPYSDAALDFEADLFVSLIREAGYKVAIKYNSFHNSLGCCCACNPFLTKKLVISWDIDAKTAKIRWDSYKEKALKQIQQATHLQD